MSDLSGQSEETPYARPAYRWYVIGILALVYAFNIIDRQILIILQEQIRVELDLMDWQLGTLSGIAFAFIYVALGLPVAHLSERVGRKKVIAVSLFVWSGMTAVCGAAQNFAQLFLARFGVGVGESGGTPPAHSIISDIFPKHRRALALSIYSSGLYMGFLIGYSAGGYLGEMLGWRMTFVVVGLPGILLALIVALTVKEPPRGMAERQAGNVIAGENEQPTFFATLERLWSLRTFRNLSLGAAMHALVGSGVNSFVPSFLIRAHGMEIADIGWRLALILGFGGAAGVWISGYLADRLALKDRRWYMRIPAIALTFTLPMTVFVFTTGNLTALFWVLGISSVFGTMWTGPSFAVTHSLVGLRQRALASAAFLLIMNLIGMGLGPVIVGALSDFMRADYGDADGLRYAIIAVSLVANVWAILHFLRAAKTVRQDIDAAH